ncbi:TetR/AcrR family transcriptional regulator C-terminal domain-containing protein [Microbispora sp. RL4-1S]|uniref:TetR/AcrR family transcriptional regulator C-terminal domain-containing protein n=1 Tax=Microbispora oryzae TaxID=2806554 RepID=A0A941AID2_9ACTN|nr:TetR/AcrR family transcriptional regulator [Microbispora oryzae]MBP2703033.1 TetR/AcrR family transcriptional regulator C-terminal domain-containing protein [Microbispora oryzae]
MRESTEGPIPLIWTQPPPPPRRRALGREEIVAAAVRLADEAGLDALTMKGVADRLGSYSPMALYRYVHNKDGLVDLMLDSAAAEIPVPVEPGDDWRADMRTMALETRAMLGRHPWFALLVHSRPPAGPHLMRRLEFMLAVLTRQGAGVADAMTYAALVDRHVVGSGLQEAEEARLDRRYGLDDSARLHAAVATLHALAAADGRLPLLTGWLAAPSGAAPEAQFELGLDFILDGIAGRLKAGRMSV